MATTTALRNVHFVPWGSGHVDRHVAVGAAWLTKQPGRPAVFVPLKQTFYNNQTLPRLLPRVEIVTARAQHGIRNWSGGPMLVCWPTEKMLDMLSGYLGRQVTAACVFEWGEDATVRAWLTAHRAIDLTTGRPTDATVTLAPVVQAAMEDLNLLVNHANGLAGSHDEGLAIQTLTELVRHGHRFVVEDLCAWAVANGFTGSEVGRLRELAGKALAGHRFRPKIRPLRSDIVQQWEAKARGESDD